MATLKKAVLSYRLVFTSLSQNYKHIPSVVAASRRNYSSTTENEENYDIIITGGGMVGTTLACAIANNRRLGSKRVLLLEGSPKQDYTPQEEYSNRVVALNQETRTLLSSFGAWKHIEAVRYCPIREMLVWDACSEAVISFNGNYLGDQLAYIVENDLLLHAVNKQLSEKENVTVIYESKVADVKLPETSAGYTTVQLQSGKRFRSRLLVGADGANSLVRKVMNINYSSWQYDQMGIVATLELSEPTENVAWQRFIPTGPIALLPLADSFSSLVWSVTNEKAKELLNVSEEEFVDRINEALWQVYPKDGVVESGMKMLGQLFESYLPRQFPSVTAIVKGSRAAFPLGFGHSASYTVPGAVLVGDAAHRVHPLAGQGVNLGFGDVTTLTQILAEAAENGSQLNNMLYLRRYETLRHQHNVPTMLAIDGLHRLYKTTAAPIILARSLGMLAINASSKIKKLLFEHASGRVLWK